MDWFIKRITNPFFTMLSITGKCTVHAKNEPILNVWILLRGETTDMCTDDEEHELPHENKGTCKDCWLLYLTNIEKL